MLEFNFDKAFRKRGISRVYSFMIKAGFSNNFTYRATKNKLNGIKLDLLEKLCIELNCTPNDLLEWKEGREKLAPDHELRSLEAKENDIDKIENSFKRLPMSKLNEIQKIIKEELEKND